MMKDKGIKIIAADSPGAFVDDAPTTTFVRQVLGAVAQLDKAMTVAKLRGARERKRRQADWCEGGAPLHERYPEAVRIAKRLYRLNPVTGKPDACARLLPSSPRPVTSRTPNTAAVKLPDLSTRAPLKR
jgi:DNA invertase Pin-like site-specific DNA recombinase